MAPKRKRLTVESPKVKQAKKVVRKYKYSNGYPKTPTKGEKVRKALKLIEDTQVSIRKAATECNLSYGYLYRRVTGDTDIDSRRGPNPIFSSEEENAMAEYLSEMAKRGMGLKPKEFLHFIQTIVKKENRRTPFKDGLPGYDWYYGFMARNVTVIGCRAEVPLESSRAKLTSEQMDKWYSDFRQFLIDKQLLSKPSQIWNADECGFSMGSKAGKVIGPAKTQGSYQVPHVTGSSSKDRLTAMFCCSAEGHIMPPFLVYPAPTPKGCNPLSGALGGTEIVYTKKGWMTAEAFGHFIEFFNKHAGTDRPVVLIIDSVSSHVDMTIFQRAADLGIEIYRLVPNATHLMQPLDRGVFGPLKAKWYQITRQHYREHPDSKIGKANFGEKLKEAVLGFYKPSTVVNSFKATGVYPVDRSKIGDDELKPGLTHIDKEVCDSTKHVAEKDTDIEKQVDEEVKSARGALNVFESVLTTPVRERYKQRIDEKYDITGVSPGFDTYKRLVEKTKVIEDTVQIEQTKEPNAEINDCNTHSLSALDILANAAMSLHGNDIQTPTCSKAAHAKISPIIVDALTLPKANTTRKKRARRLLQRLPDSLTSPETIRMMALNDIKKVREFAEKEKRAKARYLIKLSKSKSKEKGMKSAGKKKTGPHPVTKKCIRQLNVSSQPVAGCSYSNSDNPMCMVCGVYWSDDQLNSSSFIWVECGKCKEWVHEQCIPEGVDKEPLNDEDRAFICHRC